MTVLRATTGRRSLPMAATAMLTVLVSGCGLTLQNVTLPGGATSKGVFLNQKTKTYEVYFTDALDLVPQSSVHVDDVNVGSVESIKLVNGLADVKIQVLSSVPVPANAQGVLAQTSLLGEKFVSLVVPAGTAPQGVMADNAVIPVSNTSQDVEAEDVFGALADLLNGGGLEQLQTISVELDHALTGHQTQIRDLLSQLTIFTSKLDERRSEITRALDSLDRLAVTLKGERATIATALDKITPGLAVLDDSRKDLIQLLASVKKLGTVAVRVENRTQAQTITDLQALQPTLDRLSSAGDNIVNSLQLLVTFPFGDNALKAIFSDYTGLKATLNIDLRPGSPANPLGATGACGEIPTALPGALASGCATAGTVVNSVAGGVTGLLGGGPAAATQGAGGLGGLTKGVPTTVPSVVPTVPTVPAAVPAPTADAPVTTATGAPSTDTPANPLGGLTTVLGGGGG